MNGSENNELFEFHEKFMTAAMRVHNAECFGVPYSETPEYKRLERILIEASREKTLQKHLGKEHRRVGEPVRHRRKSPSQKFLEVFRKKRRLSYDELIQILPEYAYAIPDLIAIKMRSGHIIEVGENVYEITEKGRQSITYGFEKKFFKLNKHR